MESELLRVVNRILFNVNVTVRQVSARGSGDVQGQPKHRHCKSNVLYVANSMKVCREAFDDHQSLGLVLDEVRTPTNSLLQAFLATPITHDVAQGFTCPPQIMPDTHVCLGSKSVGVRIAEATTAAVAGDRMSGKPTADPLVFTWNTIKAMENTVRNVLPVDGLMRFMPEDRMLPVVSGEKRLLFDIGGRQRWMTQSLDEDGVQQQSRVLPGDRVLSLTACYPLTPLPSVPSSLCCKVYVIICCVSHRDIEVCDITKVPCGPSRCRS